MRRSDWPNVLTPTAYHILVALSDEDRHGIGIMKEVDRYTSGDVHLGPGTLYGTIKKLRAADFIAEGEPPHTASEADPRNRYYSVTESGREALLRHTRHLATLVRVAESKAGLAGTKIT